MVSTIISLFLFSSKLICGHCTWSLSEKLKSVVLLLIIVRMKMFMVLK